MHKSLGLAAILVVLLANVLAGCAKAPVSPPDNPNVSDKEIIVAVRDYLKQQASGAGPDALEEALIFQHWEVTYEGKGAWSVSFPCGSLFNDMFNRGVEWVNGNSPLLKGYKTLPGVDSTYPVKILTEVVGNYEWLFLEDTRQFHANSPQALRLQSNIRDWYRNSPALPTRAPYP